MRPIKMNPPSFTPNPPPVPPPPMLSTPFEPDDAPLPPAPAQMNAPVGPPPPPVEVPKGYEGFMEAALKARVGRADMALLWAAMAQADAQNRIAFNLQRLLAYLGADDVDADGLPDDSRDGPRLEDQITAGVFSAALALKDQAWAALPQQLVDALKAKLAEAMEPPSSWPAPINPPEPSPPPKAPRISKKEKS